MAQSKEAIEDTDGDLIQGELFPADAGKPETPEIQPTDLPKFPENMSEEAKKILDVITDVRDAAATATLFNKK